jgi:Uma2 family endonuclease
MSLEHSISRDAPYTVDDFRAIPDDGKLYELLFGEIVLRPTPGAAHQLILGELLYKAQDALRDRDGEVWLSPFDVYLSPYNVVEPDLMLLLPSGTARVADDGIHGPPDIVIEIVVPATRERDLVKKVVLYALAGVQEYWVVDRDTRTITVKRLKNGRYFDVPADAQVARSTLLPAFGVEIAPLFETARLDRLNSAQRSR